MYYIHLGYLADIDIGIFILQYLVVGSSGKEFFWNSTLNKKTFNDIRHSEFNISDNRYKTPPSPVT